MPEEFKGWKLIKEYENFGLYTNGLWRTCFSKFDVGLIERRTARGMLIFINSGIEKRGAYSR